MRSIKNFLKDIKNLLPYFLLIVIYFFFVNLEARKENVESQNGENGNIGKVNKSINDNGNLRIKIPVIPYKQ